MIGFDIQYCKKEISFTVYCIKHDYDKITSHFDLKCLKFLLVKNKQEKNQ